MKKKLLLPFFVFISSFVLAQNQSIYFSIGKPSFPDVFKNEKNISFGVHYQNRFSESFAYEVDYQYAQSDSYPDFFSDSHELNSYLLSQHSWDIFSNSLWSKIQSHSIGIKLDYLFVNNQEFLFGFNLGLGYLFSSSSLYDVYHWSYYVETGEIISYESETENGNMNKFYYSLGIQFQYTFYKKFLIGIRPEYLMPFERSKVYVGVPLIPNYFNLSITFGKRF
ncbi:MAG: hypothetical protein JXR65_10150 [Bacteroidales bacterium]|nr:hypothetical protein [Bacteroidales bacterium]